MRQIGTLPTQPQAERFTAYLITQGVPAQADQEGAVWEIWVREEDHLDQAKQALDEFQRAPEDPRYQGVLREANAKLQDELKRREQARKNVVQVGRRWSRPGLRKTPLVTVVILLCSIVFVLTGLGRDARSTPYRVLGFCDSLQRSDWDVHRLEDRLIDINRGQVWRLITPIFMHADILHLLFNMIMFHAFASRIEAVKGTWKLGLFVLLIALPSNLAQGLAPATWGTLSGGPAFVGISGVVYGLMGYLWMKTMYAPESGLYVSAGTVLFMLVFMFLGFSGLLNELFRGDIANLAHGVGLLAGMALGYLGKSPS
jgi:GlpG protein